MKLNVDAGVKEEDGVGLGLVGRDHRGDVLFFGSRSLEWSTKLRILL